jgi:hypothetical protein
MRFLLCLGLFSLLNACNTVLGVDEPKPRPAAGDDGAAGAVSDGSRGDGSGGSPECTSHAQCLDKTGEFDPSACIDGSCVKLLTESCPLLLPAADRGWVDSLRSSNAEPIIFGAFVSMQQTTYGIQARNFDLAFTEVMNAAGGIPSSGGKKRALLALVCQNHYETEDALDAAVDHLIGDLRVPGILPTLETHDLLHAFERSGAENHVLFMSPLGSEQALLDATSDGLIWTMLPGAAAMAPTYSALLDLSVEHLRTTGALGKDEPVRVALVRASDYVATDEMASAITDQIRFNGKSAADNAPEYFKSVSVPSVVLANTTPDYSTAMQALIDFAPQIVISSATDEFYEYFMPALEYALEDHPPMYLLSPFNTYINSQTSPIGLCDPTTDDTCHDARTRVVGINYAGAADQTNYDAYQARFDAAYTGYPRSIGYENYYDAAYYLIYSAAAASGTPLRGDDLKIGMRRLLNGRAFNVGPGDLADAYRELGIAGNTITLNGAMGPPDFDARTGARSTPGTVWCLDEHLTVRTDVLRLDADGHLAGDFPCFTFP